MIARNAYFGFQFEVLSAICKMHPVKAEATNYIKQAYDAKLISEGEHSPEAKRWLPLTTSRCPSQDYSEYVLKNGICFKSDDVK